MINLLYTPLIGIPICVTLCTLGAFLVVTIVGAGIGLTMIALGIKALTL